MITFCGFLSGKKVVVKVWFKYRLTLNIFFIFLLPFFKNDNK